MFFSLLEQRRSIRRYQDRPVAPEQVEQLIEAALRAPSSRGFDPWEFVVVTERDLLGRLSLAKPHGAAFLGNAPLGIVVCADTGKSDVWVEDTAIAAILIHLAAASLGLGSCWIQIRNRMHDDRTTAEAYVRGLLGLPDAFAVASVMAVGHPAESKEGHPRESLQRAKVHLNAFGRAYPVAGR